LQTASGHLHAFFFSVVFEKFFTFGESDVGHECR
jgi:hypothetical protein